MRYVTAFEAHNYPWFHNHEVLERFAAHKSIFSTNECKIIYGLEDRPTHTQVSLNYSTEFSSEFLTLSSLSFDKFELFSVIYVRESFKSYKKWHEVMNEFRRVPL